MESKTINQPAYDVVSGKRYIDKQTNEEKMGFTRVGVAFNRKEKDGFYLKLNLQSSAGEYYLLPRKEKAEGEKTPF